jgi:hypothetical protein
MKAIATLILFLCYFGLFSQCVSGDCNNGYGKYIYGNGGVYEGNFKNGYEHGFGRINFNSGAKYEGEWLNGKKSGKGTYCFADGSVKEGEFVNGVFVKGSVKLPSGDKYIGSEVNGMFNGKGTFTWTNGDKYEGDFLDGELHGNGKITKANGTIKTGVWSHNSFIEKKTEEPVKNSNSQANTSNKTGSPCISGDCKNGFGKLQDANSVYEGNFLNGEKNGKGTQVFSSGARFEGNFLNDKKSGKGTYTFEDGSKYIGDFLDGKLNGNGILYYANGLKEYEGYWLNGYYNGKGKSYDKDNGRLNYDGDWLNGKAHGKGTLIKSDGTTLTGDFVDGEYQKPFVIEPASIGAKWNNGDANQQGMSSMMLLSSYKGVLTKTGNTTFTFKWENAKKEVKTEYLTLKSSKEGMCQSSALFAQEKCKISEYTIKGNSDRKAIINWYSGKKIEVKLYNDFGELIGNWDLIKE